jgi:hypothetical protein
VRWIAVMMLACGCGRVFFSEASDAAPMSSDDAVQAGPAPLHRYRLAGSFADDAGGPALLGLGGSLLDGKAGYKFTANNGLKLVGGMPAGAYTIDIRFVFDQVGACNPGGGHYCKLMDFKDVALDEGLYALDEKLHFVILANGNPVFVESLAVFSSGVEATVTLTRDAAGNTTAYVDREQRFSFLDTTAMAQFTRPGQVAHFAVDDQATAPREASSGSIREIVIWDVVLTRAEIAAL